MGGGERERERSLGLQNSFSRIGSKNDFQKMEEGGGGKSVGKSGEYKRFTLIAPIPANRVDLSFRPDC